MNSVHYRQTRVRITKDYHLCYMEHFWKSVWGLGVLPNQPSFNGHFQSSLTPRCDAHGGVRLPGVHHNAESSPMCIILQSQVTKIYKISPQCASHCGVKLPAVHHTEESSFGVCITPQSQTAHCRVKIENFVSLWMLLKGQSGEILFGVNTSIMKEKIWSKNFRSVWSNISAKFETEFKNTLACSSQPRYGDWFSIFFK